MVSDIEFVVYVDSQGLEHLAVVTNSEYDTAKGNALNDPIVTCDLFVFDTLERLKGVNNASVVNAWKPFQFPQPEQEENPPNQS